MGKHLIHHQILDLRCSDQSKAKVAMDLWSDLFQKEGIPVMEEVLDDLDKSGKWIRLAKVEIDLGRVTIDFEKIGENLSPDVFRQKLRDVLKTQLLRQIPESQSTLPKPEFLVPDLDRKPLELLDFLLLNGRKPWWASQSRKDGIQNLTLQLLDEKNRDFLDWLRSERFSQVMLYRLQNHLNRIEIQRLISQAFPEKHKETLVLSKSLVSSFCPEIFEKNELENKLERCILNALLLQETRISDPVSKWIKLNFSLAGNSKITNEAYSELLLTLIPVNFQRTSNQSLLEKVWGKWTRTPIFRNSILTQEKGVKSISILKANFLQKLKDSPTDSNHAMPDPVQKPGNFFSMEKLELDETILISNSGLVLTSPFLPFFFKGLGLVENKQFVSKSAQNRAALLLQSLLDDSFSYEESNLMLNKILCGIEPTEPIMVSFSPSETEKEEIKNLLEAMVGHWKALKSTSGSSMAQGFFTRQGSLKRVSKGYQLTIPRTSIDILLNQLPWAISIIKLPWMNETLFTEW